MEEVKTMGVWGELASYKRLFSPPESCLLTPSSVLCVFGCGGMLSSFSSFFCF